MNTRLSLLLPGVGGSDGALLSGEVQDYVAGQERMMSRFRDGEIGRLNAAAAMAAVPVSDALWAILTFCREQRSRTRGFFDIASRWSRKAGAAGGEDLVFDDQARTLRFITRETRLDLGGVGKGLALKGVEALLRRHGIEQGLISFGESSLIALGSHPSGGPWNIGLAAGSDEGFELTDEALSVSGQTADQPHIVDPHTGQWVSRRGVIAVACRCPAEAEVLSTALYAAPEAERGRILAQFGSARMVNIEQDEAEGASNTGGVAY